MSIYTPRTILVTGAGSGLGQGISFCLAQLDYQLVVTDLHLDAVKETARLIEAKGGTARAFELDVSSEESVNKFMHDNADLPPDVLINNAGLQHVARIEEFPLEKWDQLINVMLRGAFLLSRAVLPGMRERGFGRLVHIGSIHSLIASPYKSAYTAAKHALLGFSKVLALETADTEITSNTICPAYIRTPLVDAQIAGQAATRGISAAEVIDKVMLAPMPKKAFVTIEEVVAAIDFLISPMARNITGQTLTIDGGWTAQ